MPRYTFCWLLLLVTGATAPAAVTITRFESPGDWSVLRAQETGAAFTSITNPDVGAVGRISWEADHPAFIELHLRRPIPLRAFEKELSGSIRLRLASPPPPSVNGLSLRLRDSKGEVFQWARPFTADRHQKQLVYELSSSNFDSSWHTSGTATGVPQPPMSLVGFSIQLAQDEQSGHLDFEKVVYGQANLPLSDLVTVKAETRGPLSILTPEGSPSPTLLIRNHGEDRLALTLDATLESYAGERQTFSRNLDMKADSSERWTLPTQLSHGIFWIDYALRERGTGRVSEGATSLVRMTPAGPAKGPPGEFLFGLNTHMTWYGEREQELEALAAGLVGARIVRTHVAWDRLEPEPNQWNWEPLDRLLALLDEQGIQLQYMLGFTPRWASTAPPEETAYRIWSRMPPRLDAWGNYVQKMAGRYGDRIPYWEVWNEPDLDFFRGTADDYLAMAEAVHETVKRVNPDAEVMSAGFSSRRDGEAFIEEVLRRGNSHIDVLAWHQHGTVESLREIVDGRLADLRRHYLPGKPVYFNECGFAVPDTSKASQRRQAEVLVRKMTFLWSRGAIAHNWYQLRDDVMGPTSQVERSFGMLNSDFTPKASYASFNTLARLLDRKRFVGELDLGPQAAGLLFADADEQVVVLYAEGATEHRAFITDAREAVSVDLMGNEMPLPIPSGGATVAEVTPTPSYLVLKGARRAAGGPVILRPLSRSILPGGPNTLAVEVTNPVQVPQRVVLTFTLNEQTVNAEGSLGGGESRRVEFEIDAQALPPGKRTEQVMLAYRFDDGVERHVRFTLDVATPIAPSVEDRAADFDLRDPQHVVNLFPDDPHQTHMQWQGPEDLSAKVWLAAGSDALRVRVNVTDDVHHQPNDGGLWRADSVQVGLRVPGQRGFWELTLARLGSGHDAVQTASRPGGAADPTAAISLKTTPRERGLVYDVTIPREVFGLDDAQLASGVGFTLLVNDSDGLGREGWIEMSSGLGSTKDPTRFPILVLPARRN